MNSFRTTAQVITGLQCLADPDHTGGRCYDCASHCDDPEKVRDRIIRDALAILEYQEDKRIRRFSQKGKNDGK